MSRQVVREAYDVWGQPLGWVLATVPDQFDVAKAPIPREAPRQFFTKADEVMRAVGFPLPDPPDQDWPRPDTR